VALAGHDPIAALDADARARLARIERALRDGGATPPDPTDLRSMAGDGAELVDLLTASGRALALQNHALRKTLLFHADALAATLARLSGAFPRPRAFKTGEAREALATSRKFIVPILEHFDARGWTVRDGDLRRIAATE
jgi:selenocysteine-specific elongation factor